MEGDSDDYEAIAKLIKHQRSSEVEPLRDIEATTRNTTEDTPDMQQLKSASNESDAPPKKSKKRKKKAPKPRSVLNHTRNAVAAATFSRLRLYYTAHSCAATCLSLWTHLHMKPNRAVMCSVRKGRNPTEHKKCRHHRLVCLSSFLAAGMVTVCGTRRNPGHSLSRPGRVSQLQKAGHDFKLVLNHATHVDV